MIQENRTVLAKSECELCGKVIKIEGSGTIPDSDREQVVQFSLKDAQKRIEAHKARGCDNG